MLRLGLAYICQGSNQSINEGCTALLVSIRGGHNNHKNAIKSQQFFDL